MTDSNRIVEHIRLTKTTKNGDIYSLEANGVYNNNLDEFYSMIKCFTNLSTLPENPCMSKTGDVDFTESKTPTKSTSSYNKKYYEKKKTEPGYKEKARLRSRLYYLNIKIK